VQEQHRKQGALPWTSDVDLPTAIGDLQWAENPELRGAPLRSSGRLAAQLWRICSRIATAPPYDVYTMPADGGDRTPLTTHAGFDGFPVWSPDGRQLAFTSGRDDNGEIYTMRADGSHERNQTRDAALDIAPDWQPLNADDD
jgi:WD40-like Beta Propeller Repeat